MNLKNLSAGGGRITCAIRPAAIITTVNFCLTGASSGYGFVNAVVVQRIGQRGDHHQRDERPHHFGAGTDDRPDAIHKRDEGNQQIQRARFYQSDRGPTVTARHRCKDKAPW